MEVRVSPRAIAYSEWLIVPVGGVGVTVCCSGAGARVAVAVGISGPGVALSDKVGRVRATVGVSAGVSARSSESGGKVGARSVGNSTSSVGRMMVRAGLARAQPVATRTASARLVPIFALTRRRRTTPVPPQAEKPLPLPRPKNLCPWFCKHAAYGTIRFWVGQGTCAEKRNRATPTWRRGTVGAWGKPAPVRLDARQEARDRF